ncbi:MAG TPA: MarR family transcriptional regulator [Candidatus Limnocylindrales bacterium]
MTSPANQDVFRLIVQLSRQMTSEFEEQLAELDLTGPQAQLLRQLDEPLPMVGAAERLHCDPSNITGIVDRLERRGLVQRNSTPGDRRVKELELTAEGRRLKIKVDEILSGMSALEGLNAGDREALASLLARSLAESE